MKRNFCEFSGENTARSHSRSFEFGEFEQTQIQSSSLPKRKKSSSARQSEQVRAIQRFAEKKLQHHTSEILTEPHLPRGPHSLTLLYGINCQ